MLCCSECFGDRGLRQSIIPALEPMRGKCQYCSSEAVDLVEPRLLADYFEMLINVYELDTDGKPIVEWMRTDWQLFSHSRMDNAHAKELLSEILDDGDIVRQNFSPSLIYRGEGLIRWESLRDELMHKNRFHLDEKLDEDQLADLISQLPADNLPQHWHRARIGSRGGLFSLAEMGAPPKRLATHGRANPAGIPYLYLGSSPETAIAEIRPHTGERACVADFKINGSLNAVDLRNPRSLVSPFLLSDASAIGQLRADIPFLERLGAELTRPVLPQGAPIDYLPSQYLCEFIKKSGYDGVVYRSSVGSGMNLALFDPSRAEGIQVEPYDVKRVTVVVERSVSAG